MSPVYFWVNPATSFIVGLRVGLLRCRPVGSPAQSLGKFYGPLVDLHACYSEHAQQRGPLKKRSFMAFNSKLGLVLWFGGRGKGEGDLQQLGTSPPVNFSGLSLAPGGLLKPTVWSMVSNWG